MIRVVRSSEILSTNRGQAFAWAKELTNYINDSLNPPSPIRVMVARTGDTMNRLIWMGDFESLSQYEQFEKEMLSDDGWREREKRESEVLVLGTVNVQIFQMLA